MEGSPRTPTRNRSKRKNIESRYFSSTTPKRQRTTTTEAFQERETGLISSPSWRTKSKFFPASTEDPQRLLANPVFLCFYEDCVHAMCELYQAKPILIQEHVAEDPWKVLVAVTLLNKTAGNKSIPVFFEIMDQWPTPATLAEAPTSLLHEMLKDLGLGEVRSSRLVALSQTYLSDPPVVGHLRSSRGKMTVPPSSAAAEGKVEVPYPPTPISHLPGCGPYALDSYRIFCEDGDEWKAVRPRDKELIKYLQWKWAVVDYRQWDPLYGPGDTIDLDYVRGLTYALMRNPKSH
ncbi:DNA glycosylase [Cubamyces lactineus]|nr:DNA glycosylase [Cubamyces lactineus]